MTSRPFVRSSVHGAVTILELDRPETLNAIDEPAVLEIADTLRRVGRDAACRAVVLTGAGRAFCAGLNLRTGLGDPQAGLSGLYTATHHAFDVTLAMREIRQPVITAIRGHAVGAGFAMVAASDLRYASRDAQFSAPFTTIGMTPGDLGLSWLLPRIIGPTQTAELFYEGGTLNADEALHAGLLNAIVDDPLARAIKQAEVLAGKPPLAIRLTKELLNASLGADGLRSHLEIERRSQTLCALSDEHAAALAQFAARKGSNAKAAEAHTEQRDP